MGIYTVHGYEHAVTLKVTGVATTGTKLQYALERPFNNWLLQVYGADGALTDWDVSLKGGLDADKVGTMINHVNTSDDEGDLKTVQGLPAQYLEIEVNGLTLDTATETTIVVIGMEL